MANGLDKYLGPEDHVHILVCTYLRMMHPYAHFHHSPNEGKRGRVAQYKITRMGVSSGFPDLIIFYEGHHLGLELKAGKNKASANQVAWLQILEENGWDTAVCTGFDQAQRVIDQWFKKIKTQKQK